MQKLWDVLVRWRTALFNGIGGFVVLILPLLGAPEVMAIIPGEYHKYVYAGVFLVNWMMRPRPAVRAADPEAEISKRRKGLYK